MENKLLIPAGLFIGLILIIFKFYQEGKQDGANEKIIEQQENQIKIQKEVIEEKKQVAKRTQLNKSKPTITFKDEEIDLFNTNSNIGWLYANRCKDCKGR